MQKTVLLMVLLNAFTTPLMLSSANVALPVIALDLGLSAAKITWVPMAYLMAGAMFVLIFGRIADMFGRKRIFLWGTASVIVTSLLALVAPNGVFLIGARFLQGVSAAMLYATQMALISSVFPPQQRGRAIGLTVSAIYFGLTCGPLIGGFLIDLYGWRASFFIHIPLAAVALFIGYYKVVGEWATDQVGNFDIKGAIPYSVSIACLCIGVSVSPSLVGVLLLLLGAVSLGIFIKVEKGQTQPLLNVNLLQTNKVFAFSFYASLTMYAAIFSNVFLISFYLQFIKQLSPTMAGSIMMLQPLTMALLSPFMGHLSDKIAPWFLASLGMLITAVGLLSLGMLSVDSSLTHLLCALVITGVGFSLFSSPNANAIMHTVSKQNYGQAAGALAIARLVGQMMSMVLVTLIFSIVVGQVMIEPSMYADLQRAIRSCFLIAASLCVPAAIFLLVRGRLHHQTKSA